MHFNMFNNIAKNLLLGANFGLEREGLRVRRNGLLAKTAHPQVFGNKKGNPYITTDFSESQLELITPVFHGTDEAINFLDSLYNIAVLELDEEFIWPQSMPAKLPAEENIPKAQFFDKEEQGYRKYLFDKYGGKKQLISGIHINFSFTNDLIYALYTRTNKQVTFREFKDSLYLKLTRNYLRYNWLLVYFFCATNVMHKTYREQCVQSLNEIAQETYSNKTAVSFRNSFCGYTNNEYLKLDYTSINNYVNSITRFIEGGEIRNIRELYTQIRLKSSSSAYTPENLMKCGVEYVELRTIDINPFVKCGLAHSDLNFIHLFLLYCLEKDEESYDNWQIESEINSKKIALEGRSSNVLLSKDGAKISREHWSSEIINELILLNEHYDLPFQQEIIEKEKMLRGEKETYAKRLVNLCRKDGYIKAHTTLAKTYKAEAFSERFNLKPYTDMELSTQVLLKESIKLGISFEVVDRNENFIRLAKGGKEHYVKQATKTNKDSYMSVLMMENKSLTKFVLQQNNISTPVGTEFFNLEAAEENISSFINKPVVIKPKTTNFGLGISIFPQGGNQENLLAGLKLAFSNDKSILVEEFIEGKEYRFLVIADEVAGVLHRVPANVVGDGLATIKQLIAQKNLNPLRGTGYKTPLEKIVVDEKMNLFLTGQKISLEYVVPEGEVVYLRDNSNISTGGDSVDVTDSTPETFKELAVSAVQAVGAKICGVDMIIFDIEDPHSQATIIELNFNPAIHIHAYPYQGEERNIARKILKLLDY